MSASRLFSRVQNSARTYSSASRISTLFQRPVTMMRSGPRPSVSGSLLSNACRIGRREYSSEGAASRGNGLWSPLFTILLLFGVGATGYGLYDLYGTLTMWPTEVRGHLRGALKAKDNGDLATSATYFRRAWEASQTLPIEQFKSQPFLKLSGIAVCLAEVLEGDEKTSEAYDVYVAALKQLQDAGIQQLTGPEKMRAVALAYKLGEVGTSLEKPEEVEKWLTYAVETVTKHVLEVPMPTETTPGEVENHLIIAELGLPDWVSTVDVAAPYEALGSFYAKAGKLDYAMPLLLQTVSILIPPAPQEATPENKCRGAQLMGSIAEMIIRNNLSRESVLQAEEWALKGLEVVVKTRKESKEPIPMCEVSYAVQLFNMASLRAIKGDIDKAKDLFTRSANQAKAIGYQTLAEASNNALTEISSRTQPKPT